MAQNFRAHYCYNPTIVIILDLPLYPPYVLIPCSCTYSYCYLFVHVDPTLTLENVSTVLATVVNVIKLRDVLLVPRSKLMEIQQQSSTVTQEREGLINYFISYSECASWTDLANSLYYYEHHEAVATAKTFIKQTPGKYIHVVVFAVVDSQYNTHVHVTGVGSGGAWGASAPPKFWKGGQSPPILGHAYYCCTSKI